MLSSLFFLIFGSLGLYFGSEFLIDGAKSLAKKLKVSDLVIGLTIVSIGTSFPELVVGLISAFKGYTDFVMGNVLGSNIANIGLAIGWIAVRDFNEDKKPKPPFDFCSNFSDEDLLKLRNKVEGRG